MKEHLKTIMEELEFLESDRNYFLSVYEAIEQDPASSSEWSEILAEYEKNICSCDYNVMRLAAKDIGVRLGYQGHTTDFLLFLCLTKHLRSVYQERGLDDALFLDTCMDLKWKLNECKNVLGFPGSFVCGWFVRFFKLERFTLGRLQFELVKFQRHYEKNGKKLTMLSPVINVHIPATGTPMDRESCEKSFRMAADFFAETFPEGTPIPFICHSWLLFPDAQDFIPEHSNLLWFYNRFEILETTYYGENHPDLWRLFDRNYTGNPDNLPCNTSLRRAYVNHIRKGGKTGAGLGLFFLEK